MSPSKAGGLTAAATLPREIPIPAVADDIPAPDDAAVESPSETGSWPTRPVSPARVRASRSARSHPFNDPSNYLG
jgi:hypothetical protein